MPGRAIQLLSLFSYRVVALPQSFRLFSDWVSFMLIVAVGISSYQVLAVLVKDRMMYKCHLWVVFA